MSLLSTIFQAFSPSNATNTSTPDPDKEFSEKLTLILYNTWRDASYVKRLKSEMVEILPSTAEFRDKILADKSGKELRKVKMAAPQYVTKLISDAIADAMTDKRMQ